MAFTTPLTVTFMVPFPVGISSSSDVQLIVTGQESPCAIVRERKPDLLVSVIWALFPEVPPPPPPPVPEKGPSGPTTTSPSDVM